MRPQFTPSDIARFWSKVNKDGPIPAHRPDLGPCWVWLAGQVQGYGQFHVGRKPDAQMIRAHRVAYFLTHGVWPPCSCHHCDTPGCVNPSHLFGGTRRENNADRARKGRSYHPLDWPSPDRADANHPEWQTRGDANGRPKLTASDVIEMRRLYADGGWTYRALGRHFTVSYPTARSIIRREKWAHLP